MICVLQNVSISTSAGRRALADTRVGDRVINSGKDLAPIAEIHQNIYTTRELVALPHLRPVMIQAGALGGGLPTADLMVSPNQRILVSREMSMLAHDQKETFVAAKHLVDNKAIFHVEVAPANYVHFVFDRHETLTANGIVLDCFQAHDFTLGAHGNAQRNEIYEIFPTMRVKAAEITAARKAAEAELVEDAPEPRKKRFLFF